MSAPAWRNLIMRKWITIGANCKMGVCHTLLRLRQTKKTGSRVACLITMKKKRSEGFAVSLYKSGSLFIGLQHLIQQGIQQSAVRRIVPPSIPPQPEIVAVQAGEGSSGQGNAGAVRDGWFPLRLSFFLSHRLLRGG